MHTIENAINLRRSSPQLFLRVSNIELVEQISNTFFHYSHRLSFQSSLAKNGIGMIIPVDGSRGYQTSRGLCRYPIFTSNKNSFVLVITELFPTSNQAWSLGEVEAILTLRSRHPQFLRHDRLHWKPWKQWKLWTIENHDRLRWKSGKTKLSNMCCTFEE